MQSPTTDMHMVQLLSKHEFCYRIIVVPEYYSSWCIFYCLSADNLFT